MNVIIDTNVLISGIFFKGPPFEILREWKKGKFTLVISHEILEEYQRVIADLQKSFPKINAGNILDAIILKSQLTFSIVLKEQICDDPDDDKFIAAALASKCKVIVSGDKYLLRISGYRNINVIKPILFLDNFLRRAAR